MEREVPRGSNERSKGEGEERRPSRLRVKCREMCGPCSIGVMAAMVMAIGAFWLCFLLQDAAKEGSQRSRGKRNIAGTNPLLSQEKEWTHMQHSPWDGKNEEEKYPRMKNKWYKYVHVLAKSYNKTNCYVCSKLPFASNQVTLYARRMSEAQAGCFASMARSGHHEDSLMLEGPHGTPTPGVDKGYCAKTFWVVWYYTVKGYAIPQSVVMEDAKNHPICYRQNLGKTAMGTTTNCDQIKIDPKGAPLNVHAPSNGTFMIQGGWWLCGNNAYITLPFGWRGTCAPIFVTDHTVFITEEEVRTRKKREAPFFVAHDSVWGSDVPQEYKHWTTGQKVLLALFPWVGTSKNMLRIETVDYRLGLFINSSLIIEEAQNREIDAIRTMVMQNRMALDLLTAATGGTCVLLNTSCCTYITDDVHSQNMTDALGRLYQLQRAMAADHKPRPYESWYDWLFNGSWRQVLIKTATMLGAGLLTVICVLSCVIPSIRGITIRAINTLTSVSGLTSRMEPIEATVYIHMYDDMGRPVNVPV
ncbi:uncharacterized protein LOC130196699 [Pseudoliparis swirei]|uniref:uncharacterized protein LOC130196699 n=1 Tax=Pseudoliparis swirei TaxID=2059687 RepID=UPI0024BE26F8|nr:uncharacterized protein LOC130196699 [Pseudoliparis swirei]